MIEAERKASDAEAVVTTERTPPGGNLTISDLYAL